MLININSLLMDSLKLPQFRTIYEFADLIGLSSRLLYCLSMKTNNYYKQALIPKCNGMYREINIPSYTLNIVQRWILVNILDKLSPSTRAMAFRRGSLYGHKQNALYHAHTFFGLSIDLKDFFPSIYSNKVYTIFSNIGYNRFASTILTNICTLNGKLPQGSACSPAISNIICISLDKRIIGLCDKRGIRFTRYADDMYFSCDDKTLLLKIYPIIKMIIENEGFIINDRKVFFHTPSNRKRITGVTISTISNDDNIRLKAPKELKKKIRAEIFKCIISGKYELKSHILGEIAYVAYIENVNNESYLSRIKRYISNIAKKYCHYPELIEAYNKNIFYKDLEFQKAKIISATDEEDFSYYSCELNKRKKFLQKNNLNDICRYSEWPLEIFNDYYQPNDDVSSNDLPF